jgi:hypothetical protein
MTEGGPLAARKRRRSREAVVSSKQMATTWRPAAGGANDSTAFDTATHEPTFKEPVTGYALSDDRFDAFVHIRELMVVTEGQRSRDSPLGAGRRVDLVNLRGF